MKKQYLYYHQHINSYAILDSESPAPMLHPTLVGYTLQGEMLVLMQQRENLIKTNEQLEFQLRDLVVS